MQHWAGPLPEGLANLQVCEFLSHTHTQNFCVAHYHPRFKIYSFILRTTKHSTFHSGPFPGMVTAVHPNAICGITPVQCEHVCDAVSYKSLKLLLLLDTSNMMHRFSGRESEYGVDQYTSLPPPLPSLLPSGMSPADTSE